MKLSDISVAFKTMSVNLLGLLNLQNSSHVYTDRRKKNRSQVKLQCILKTSVLKMTDISVYS